MNVVSMFKAALACIRKPGIASQAVPISLVLFMSEPYKQTVELYEQTAEKAFGIQYDGSDPMYFVSATPDFFFLKAGSFLISTYPHYGAYLAKDGEFDTATGAANLHENQTAWWHQQRAWIAFDIQNQDVAEKQGMQVLAKLLLPLLDHRCCGIWIPTKREFLPNDGRALEELTRLSL